MGKNLKIKKIYLNLLVLLIGIFVVLSMFLISWEKLNSLPSLCIFKNLFGIECLGCGTVRAFWLLIHFKFAEAFKMNCLVYIYILIFIFLTIKIKKN
jgi:hypothetical protein